MSKKGIEKLSVWVTSDGVQHATEAKARHHASERYGAALCAMARSITHLDGNYSRILGFLKAPTTKDAMANILALATELDYSSEELDALDDE